MRIKIKKGRKRRETKEYETNKQKFFYSVLCITCNSVNVCVRGELLSLFPF